MTASVLNQIQTHKSFKKSHTMKPRYLWGQNTTGEIFGIIPFIKPQNNT